MGLPSAIHVVVRGFLGPEAERLEQLMRFRPRERDAGGPDLPPWRAVGRSVVDRRHGWSISPLRDRELMDATTDPNVTWSRAAEQRAPASQSASLVRWPAAGAERSRRTLGSVRWFDPN